MTPRERIAAAKKRTKRLVALAKASQRLRESMSDDHIEIARYNRKTIRGSGGSWFFSHARAIEFVDALAALQPGDLGD